VSTAEDPEISVVVPVYDEAEALPRLHAELTEACAELGRTYEVLLVDDGSRDGSAELLDELAERDVHLRVVHLRRNFGKSPALAAAFERVRGSIVVQMDADLQDDPAMIGRFVEKIEGGADLVSGWKKVRRDPLGKTLPSRLFNWTVRVLSGVRLRDFNCGYKAYRAECIRELSVYGGLHRFLPVLAAARGFSIDEVVVEHRARTQGRSKYGPGRMLDGLFDLLTVLLVTRFRTRPLHFFGIPGFLVGLTGIGILVYLSALWFSGESIGTRPLLTLGVLLTITAAQFVGIGLLAELLVRTTIRPGEVFSVRAEHKSAALQPRIERDQVPPRPRAGLS
jgi:glycosyltransferase involved in cell wall biosynthesis